ncbi:MAG: hypothetical protein P1U68_09355 [Verrucomicrobiales bacterium]|nr:hypothetical protein [Verrucomicrobiales bacterium]
MNKEENDSLIDDLLEQNISESDFLKLEAELIVSPEAREAYYERLKLHTGLQEEARSSNDSTSSGGVMTNPPHRKLDPILLAAIGALTLLVGILGWKTIAEPPAAKKEPVASGYGVIADLAEAEWETGLNLSRGDLIPNRAVKLLRGRVRIELFNGIVLVVKEKSTFTLLSETEFALQDGFVHVRLPSMPIDFRLTIPEGDVIHPGSEFAVEASTNQTAIDVIDGTVEWSPGSGEKQIVPSGNTLQWQGNGTFELIPTDAISMADVEAEFHRERTNRLARWKSYRDKLLQDPTLFAYYAMEPTNSGGKSLQDLSGNGTVGAVVLANQTPGRWNNPQSALDFSPMGSRVRVDIPGEHQSLSLMCWVKIDSLDRLYNSLFLTDGHELHEPHWQILNNGRLFFSVRATRSGKGKDKHIAHSPPIWTPAQSGQWMHLATVYDSEAFTITHYVDGDPVSIDQIPEKLHPEKVTIGAASIGNWSEPRYRKDAEFAVRNLNGSIDELGMWGRALSAQEVRKISEKGKP